MQILLIQLILVYGGAKPEAFSSFRDRPRPVEADRRFPVQAAIPHAISGYHYVDRGGVEG